MSDVQAPILVDFKGPVAVLTLNMPGTLNALGEQMLLALQTALDELAQNRQVKVVILANAGDHFCAGHDLKEMTARRGDADGGSAYFENLFALCSEVMMSVVRLPQPVIAQVKGVATAAGCQLVASCDLAVGSQTARFATPGVNIGLFCSTPMVALSRNVGRKHAMEMLLLGDFVSASKAAEIGLLNKVVPDQELEPSVMALADQIVSKSPKAIKIGKEAFYKQAELGLDEAYAYAAKVMAENMLEADAKEGIGAFLGKRSNPQWGED